MNLPINQVIHGNALEVLRKIPSESIDLVITSPPYWGLRDYGEEAKAIYGEAINCQHEWLPNYVQYAICKKCGAYYGQLGLEPHPNMFIDHIIEIIREIKRILKPEGSFYLNMGDTYAGSCCGKGDKTLFQNFRRKHIAEKMYNKPSPQAKTEKHGWLRSKQRLLIPERIAIKMQEEGWILRNTIIWFKPNHMPESVRDRFTKSWESIFFFVKQPKYYFNLDAVREIPKLESIERWSRALKQKENGNIKLRKKKLKSTNVTVSSIVPKWFEEIKSLSTGEICKLKGKNPGDCWEIPTKPFFEAHFAVFPPELCLRPILASCPPNGIVLDPFSGSGTTLVVAKALGRHYIGIEILKEYVEMSKKRLAKITPPLIPIEKIDEALKTIERLGVKS